VYIGITWISAASAQRADVEVAIHNCLASLGFKNAFAPMDGLILANTPGNKKSKVDDLEVMLHAVPVTFVIAATQRGWLPWLSHNIDERTCEDIADYDG
jgi:hypothetical protein